MKYRSVVGAALVMNVGQACYASGYGVGASFNGNENTIYLPINFGASWRVEPYVLYGRRSSDNAGALVGSSTTIDVGVGLFNSWKISSQVQVYGGARVAHHSYDSSSYDSTGFGIAPTLGGEYFLIEHVSVAAEASASAWRLKNDYDGESLDSTDKTVNTITQVVLRFIF